MDRPSYRVQRVVYNVAMWYERHGTARYFILDAKTNQLVEVTTDSLGPATSGGPRRSFTVARSIRSLGTHFPGVTT